MYDVEYVIYVWAFLNTQAFLSELQVEAVVKSR